MFFLFFLSFPVYVFCFVVRGGGLRGVALWGLLEDVNGFFFRSQKEEEEGGEFDWLDSVCLCSFFSYYPTCPPSTSSSLLLPLFWGAFHFSSLLISPFIPPLLDSFSFANHPSKHTDRIRARSPEIVLLRIMWEGICADERVRGP